MTKMGRGVLPSPSMSGRFTFDALLQLMIRRGVLGQAIAEELAAKQSAQRFRVAKERGLSPGGRGGEELSPAELLASFEAPTPSGAILTEDRIMQTLAEDQGLPYVKIDPLELDAALITSTLSRPFAKRHRILPLGRAGLRLRVATDDPFDHEALESVRHRFGGDVDVVVSSKTDILRHIREIYGFRTTLQAAAADLGVGPNLGNLEQLIKLKSLDEIESTDQHIVNAVEYLLHYAFDQRASDLHLEPKREEALVRMRIDGVLHTIQRVPESVHRAIVSRIKTMARLDIAEKRRPQDGRIKTRRKDDLEIELRVSTLPVAFGEKVVIRVFDPEVLLQDLDSLGFLPEQLRSFQDFIDRPHGLLLVTGPTGSGKTTTLYSALQILATEKVNVTTIEDPIEMVVEDFNQSAVLPKAGVTFASNLRTLLRQDPDVIMVGEIRDGETARNAVQAALTGHLVLTTVHTNDSATAITRLLELDVQPFLLASTLTGVVAQRLVRKVCDDCRETTMLEEEQVLALGLPLPEEGVPELEVAYGKGCPECRHTGLRGRCAIYEILPFDDRQRRLVLEGAPATQMMKAARADGMVTLREAAIRKLAQGTTSFEEVLRVTVG